MFIEYGNGTFGNAFQILNLFVLKKTKNVIAICDFMNFITLYICKAFERAFNLKIGFTL